jgi:hypothetical protein
MLKENRTLLHAILFRYRKSRSRSKLRSQTGFGIKNQEANDHASLGETPAVPGRGEMQGGAEENGGGGVKKVSRMLK